MTTTTRRGALKLFGALGALTTTGLTAAAAKGKRDVVTQRELQELLNLYNRGEILAASIRRRFEAGADLERGELGVSTWCSESLEWHEAHGGIGKASNVPFVGMNVDQVDAIENYARLLREHPDPDAFVIC